MAALAHSIAGHHTPHWVVLVLTLAISIPVCVALSSVSLSRLRLAAAVLTSQGMLHGLFALLPATGGNGSLREVGSGHHQHHLVLGAAAEEGAAAATGLPMTLSHLCAAAMTYTLLRRGELILHALIHRLRVRPVLLLSTAAPMPHAGPLRCIPAARRAVVAESWLSAGPRTLRGPPLQVN